MVYFVAGKSMGVSGVVIFHFVDVKIAFVRLLYFFKACCLVKINKIAQFTKTVFYNFVAMMRNDRA
jgi:hypothetical protein